MGSWACSADMQTTYFSPEMFRLLGLPIGGPLPSAEAIGSAFAPGDWKRIRELFEGARRDKRAWEGEFRSLLPDGSNRTIHILGNPVPNASGDVVEFLCVAADVTEQRQFQAAINAIPEPVWIMRPDGFCDFVSQPWLNYTGLDHAGFIAGRRAAGTGRLQSIRATSIAWRNNGGRPCPPEPEPTWKPAFAASTESTGGF